MTLSRKDKQDIVEMITLSLKGVNNSTKNAGASKVKVKGKPQELKPFSDRNEIINGLTLNDRVKIWGDVETNNLFKQRYKAGKELFEVKNIDGKPSLPYLKAFEGFILPICKSHKKMTSKQLASMRINAVKQLKMKADTQTHPKAKQWVENAINEIKGLTL